eukprot:1825670-Rhodomonas_salina.1
MDVPDIHVSDILITHGCFGYPDHTCLVGTTFACSRSRCSPTSARSHSLIVPGTSHPHVKIGHAVVGA